MSYQEKEKALRIMEALSAVDEDLLARCEDSGVKKVVLFHKYTKVLAACAACLVLGIGLLATRDMVNWSGMSASENTAEPMQGIATDGMMNADSVKQEAESSAEESVLGDVSLENAYEGGNKHIPGELAGMDSAGCPVDNRENLTLEEARCQALVGEYLPLNVPDGYVLESAKGSAADSDAKEVIVCFSRGMDTIVIHVTDKYGSEESKQQLEERMADLENAESYNVHLYEIPYAETVPEEYQESFYNPVFRVEDMTRELVEARMKIVADAGDTDTPRGNLAILYDNGVCVEINADATVEEVWTMIQSIEP